MGGPKDSVARRIAKLANRAHGVVTRQELLRAGVTARQIERLLESGALVRVYPGVYRVGHQAPSVKARYMAAVKACGEGAVLSGLAAAYLLGLVKGKTPPPEVTAPRRRSAASRRDGASGWRRPGSEGSRSRTPPAL
jgi:hypothetical protein